MPTVITLANSKGGVAKTTTTFQIAHELAQRGMRVLVIDGDSQKSLTKNMGLEARPGQPTILAVLTEPGQGIARAIVPYAGTPDRPITYPGSGKIDLIPGAKQISDAPIHFDRTRDRQPVTMFEHVLPYLIREQCQGYDVILLDPSPSQDRINAALVFAAGMVIAPVAAEPMALDGVQELLHSLHESNIARAGLHLPGQTRLAGLLIAKVYPDQMPVVTQLQSALDANRIGHFDGCYVPYTTAGWASPAERLPIALHQPGDAAAEAYRRIAAMIALEGVPA